MPFRYALRLADGGDVGTFVTGAEALCDRRRDGAYDDCGEREDDYRERREGAEPVLGPRIVARHADGARQLRASDTRDGADSNGLGRNLFGSVERNRLNHAALLALPKLRVVGSSPIARFDVWRLRGLRKTLVWPTLLPSAATCLPAPTDAPIAATSCPCSPCSRSRRAPSATAPTRGKRSPAVTAPRIRIPTSDAAAATRQAHPREERGRP
jgi:hypothetical protein